MRHSDKRAAVLVNIEKVLPRHELDALAAARPSEFASGVVRSMRKRGYDIIILSSYPEQMRDVIEAWLIEHNVPFTKLLMNADMGNDTDDDERALICGALYDEHVRDYYCVLFAIEGNPVIAATIWASRGIHCL